MKYVLTAIIIAMMSSLAWAQEEDKKEEKKEEKEGYQFTSVIEIPTTSVKNQHRSGTCWCFATNSFIETEMIRMGKPEVDLSEMYVVWHTYKEKAERYVRMHGNINFAAGGAFHDGMHVLKRYGYVPEEIYNGLTIGEELPVHGEMDNILKGFVNGVIQNKNRKLTPVWLDAYKDVLSNYLGEIPESFEVDGKEYTPLTYAKEYMGINPDDYVEIGSYTHHPFYEKFAIEIPDNWLWGDIYNVPLDEMMEIIDNALENGYSVAWGADVSDKGFATRNKGIAVIPDVNKEEMSDSEISKWEDMSKSDQQKELYNFDKPGAEKTITQEMRQIDFDNYETTDDHGMHFVGISNDQNGTPYYKVKNSWGDYNKYDGYFYASKPFVALKTTDIMIHKDAIPKKIRKKLGIK